MKVFLRILLSVGISAALLLLLTFASDADFGQAWRRLRSLPPEIFFAALGVHMCTYSIRALRFRMLIPAETRPDYRRLLVISAAHNMASYLLPAKTGEASWVVYLKSHCGVRAATGLASLVVARLLDGAVLCSALAASCLYLGMSGRYDHLEFLAWMGWSLIGLMLVFALFAWRGDWMVKIVTAVLKFARLHHWHLGDRFLASLYQVALALRDAGTGHRLGIAAALTIPIWGCVFLFYHLHSRHLGIPADYSYFETIFGSSLAVMANLLPVNGMAGAGTQEGGWTAGFGLIGVDTSVALETSLGVHAVQLFNVVSMGVVAHLIMGAMPRLSHPDMEEAMPSAELPPID